MINSMPHHTPTSHTWTVAHAAGNRAWLSLLFVLSVLCTARANTNTWHVEQASLRFTVRGDDGGGTPPDAAQVTVCPTGLNPESLQPLMYTADGQRVACSVMYARAAEPMTLIFDNSRAFPNPTPDPDTTNESSIINHQSSILHLYLVDKSAKFEAMPCNPLGGPVMETRTSTNLAEELSLDQFRAAWDTAEWTNGSSVAGAVYHAFPTSPPRNRTPREYDKQQRDGMLLSRYFGHFKVAVTDNKELEKVKRRRKKAVELKASALKRAAEIQEQLLQAEYELYMAHQETNSVKISKEVLRKRLRGLESERNKYSRHISSKATRTISIADEVIREIENGTHTFSAGARLGAHVLLDGNPILTWSPQQQPNKFRGHYINLEKVVTNLSDGVHSVEYLHYGSHGEFLAMLAWKPPGERAVTVMPGSAFLPVGRATVEGASFKTPGESRLLFSWRIREDARHPGVGDIVQVDYEIADPLSGRKYRWDFGDGSQAEGTVVSHVYLLAGMYRVTMTESPQAGSDGEVRRAEQEVCAHVLWDKHHLANLRSLEKLIVRCDLSGMPLDNVINAYEFAVQAASARVPLTGWREHARATLAARLDELPAGRVQLVAALAEDAAGFRVQAYSDAARCYRIVMEHYAERHPGRLQAALALANLLTDCLGDPATAMEVLDSVYRPTLATVDRRRWSMLRADTLLALGRTEEAVQILDTLLPERTTEETTLGLIKQRGTLRQAEGIVEQHPRNTDQLTSALQLVEAVIEEDPRLAVTPKLNLIRLDIYLGRGENRRARHLAERLLNLQPDNTFAPALLSRRVRALKALGDTETALQAMGELAERYPYDPATAEARQALSGDK